MDVLIACECSGVVRDAFRKKGHNAYSCDVQTDDNGKDEFHFHCDLKHVIKLKWDLMIAHPPCTHLARCGAKHWKDKSVAIQLKAFYFFLFCLKQKHIPKIAVENPAAGRISTWFRRPDQIINPFEFGHPYRKPTGLWLKNLPHLKPTHKQYANMGYYDQQKLLKQETLDYVTTVVHTAKERSKTFSGIAKAMADQWS